MDGKCCDVCECNHTLTDCTNELDTLVSCLDQLGPIGEVKASEWIRGSHASWTDGFDKASPSFGSDWSHSQKWWRNFMQACHALGYVERQFKSIIKHSGYAIQPVYIPTMCGRSFLEKNNPLMLPVSQHTESSAYSPVTIL